MLRARERAGQLRLFCPPLDQYLFWRCRWDGGPSEFDHEAYQDALDRHDFEARHDDGEATAIECLACGEYRWESHPIAIEDLEE